MCLVYGLWFGIQGGGLGVEGWGFGVERRYPTVRAYMKNATKFAPHLRHLHKGLRVEGLRYRGLVLGFRFFGGVKCLPRP